jgi:hypothetical protein
LNNDPGKAISFAGIFLLIASGLTFFIQAEENENTKKNEASALKPNH